MSRRYMLALPHTARRSSISCGKTLYLPRVRRCWLSDMHVRQPEGGVERHRAIDGETEAAQAGAPEEVGPSLGGPQRVQLTTCRTTSMSVPSRYSTTATFLSLTPAGCGVPTALSAAFFRSEMSLTGRPAAFKGPLRSMRRGFTATPWSVTTTSMDSPGVVAVSTSSVTIGRWPRTRLATTIASLAPAATSLWPPENRP